MKYVENNAGTMQGTYYNTEVAENDSRFMRGSKDQGSKLSILEVLARIEPSYIICIFFFFFPVVVLYNWSSFKGLCILG